MRRILLISVIVMACIPDIYARNDDAQEKLRALTEKVSDGNEAFKEKRFQDALRLYEDASRMDTTSFIADFNRADALYELKRYKEAEHILDSLASAPEVDGVRADYHYNLASCAMAQENYSKAVENFKQTLLERPGDEAARQSYAYAKLKMKDQQDQNKDQNKDQNQNKNDQNKDQNQNKNDQNKDQNQNKNDQDQDQNNDQNKNEQNKNDQNRNKDQQNPQNQQGDQPKLSKQAAQQMLQAIQAKEKQTQEKVKKEKAAALAEKKKQKTKNW